MTYNFADTGYVDVAERIRQLKEKHPEAVLRPANPAEPFKIMEIGGREFIVYVAACYRTPDDPMPAIAVAAEPAFGKTNFTKDSEVMNAETSAWGRAILACLACDSHKVASANEVRNRQADQHGDQDDSWRENQPVTPKRVAVGSAAQGATPQRSQASTGNVPSPKQLVLIKTLTDEKMGGDITDVLKNMFTVSNLDEITGKQASELIQFLMDKR